MSRKNQILLAGAFLLLAGGGLQHQRLVATRAELAAQHATVAALEKEVRAAQAELSVTTTEHETTARDLAAARAEIAAIESSPPRLWSTRVALLRQLLDEMPPQKIPELRLLGPLDWAQVVRSMELDSVANIRALFTALRTTARQKFAEMLQQALQAFAKGSNDQLPRDIRELLPYLAPPADLEMLDRYTMLRTGKLGVPDDYVLGEKPTADAILQVGKHKFTINSNPAAPTPPGESELQAMDRMLLALRTTFGDRFGPEAGEVFEHLSPQGYLGELLRDMVERMGPEITATYGGDDVLPNLVKSAMERHSAVRPNEEITNFAQLLPYLNEVDKLVAIARPAFARIAYLRDHGRVTNDPALLRPYLDAPFDAEEAFRAVKLTLKDGEMAVNYSWVFKEKPRPSRSVSSNGDPSPVSPSR